MIEPFYQLCLYIMGKLAARGKRPENRKLSGELEALGTAGAKQSLEEFYAWRAASALAVLVWGGLVLGILALVGMLTGGSRELASVERPGYGEDARETELTVWIEGESEGMSVPFSVSGRKYSKEQAAELLTSLTENLEEVLLGENRSLDEVRKDLVLPETLADGAVSVSWETEPPDVVDYQGRISEEIPEEGVAVRIQATLTCQGQETIWSAYAKVLPKEKSPEEEKLALLQEALARSDAEQIEEEQMKLPAAAGGKSVYWEEPEDSSYGALFCLIVVCAAAVYLKGEQDLEKKVKDRRRQMIMDYPALLYKMAMLLGAGLTIQGTFYRIGKEYRQRKNRALREKRKPEIRYAYEEILATCAEMQNGVGEARAYENFGTRCQIENYQKLGSLLSQNLRKGSRGLVELLETEAEEGMEERRSQAKKLGEEAGTKLLLPMMMMLVLVMGILIIPSLMNL